MKTQRQLRGSAAEAEAAVHLEGLGWHVLARNVRLGRDEIDLVAIDPGGPPKLVCVEVRSARSTAYGMPEERVDRAKVGHLYRAAATLVHSELARQLGVAGLPTRVDVLIVDHRSEPPEVRHLRAVEPV